MMRARRRRKKRSVRKRELNRLERNSVFADTAAGRRTLATSQRFQVGRLRKLDLTLCSTYMPSFRDFPAVGIQNPVEAQ